jgi:hypothetical protein
VHDYSPPGHGGGRRRPAACNRSDADRLGSILGGAALTLYGVSRWRRGGWILAGFGVLLFRRGFTGRCFTYEMLGINPRSRTALRRGLDEARRAESDSLPRSTMLDTSHGGRSPDHVP